MPEKGRFLSKDTWVGDYNQPITLNSWLYVKANPIVYSDPSGFIYENEAEDAQEIINTLKTFDVNIKVDWGEVSSNYWFNDPVNGMNSGIRTTCDWLGGVWSLNELYIIQGAIKNIDTAMKHKMSKIIGPITISKSLFACGRGCTIGRNIDLLDSGNLPTENPNTDLTDYYVAFRAGGVPYTNFDQWTVAHEIGHVWNGTRNGLLSMGLVIYTGGSFGFTFGCDKNPANPGCNKWLYRYGDIPATGSNDNFNPLEDFAESVAAYVFPNEAQRIVQKEYAGNKYLYYPDYTNTLRWNFINWLVDHSN